MSIFRRITQSLAAKLLILFIVAGTVLLLLVTSIMGKGYSSHFRYSIQPFMLHYVELVEQELGNPPTREQALRITQNIPIDIHVHGPGQNWSTGKPLNLKEFNRRARPPKRRYADNSPRHYRPFQRFRVKEIDDELLLQIRKGEYDIYFQLHNRRDIRHGGPYGLVILASILAVLLAIYYATRLLFRPINDINDGVKKFGEGNLGHRIIRRRKDQLGELTDNVNTMAQDINNMLEAKRQLLLGISHELRSPLTRSKVNLALLPESSAQGEIAKDIEHMEQLITELLESERLNSQHTSLQPEMVQLDQLIADMIENTFGSSEIEQRFDPLEASIDIARIKLLISNLVQNALKHNGENEKLPVIQLNHDSSLGQPGFKITVQDFGSGIAPEHIPYLTEPFYRADPSRQRKTGGYGLGLYLCKMIAQAHNGKLIIKSEVGQGTEVICVMPITASQNS